MKLLIKKTVFGFLLVLVAGGVVLAVFGGQTPIKTEITRIAPTPTFEKLPPKPRNLVLAQENLTLGVTKALAKEIVGNNPNGPTLSDSGSQIAAPDPDTLVKNAIANGLENFNPGNLRPVISDSNLKIIDTDDISAIRDYFVSFQTILDSHFPTGITINADSPEQTDITSIIASFNQAIDAFYALSVPKSVLGFHKKELTLLSAQRNVFALLKSYQTDPLQAYLAIQEGDKIAEETTALDKTINAYITSRNINN